MIGQTHLKYFRNTGAIALALSVAPSNAQTPANHINAPLLVVIAKATGTAYAVKSSRDIAAAVEAKKKAMGGEGWRELLSTREIGFGAVFCVSDGKDTQYFVTHGHPTMKNAIKAAQEKARPHAASVHETFYMCGSPWQVTEPAPTKPDTMMNKARRQILDRVGKDCANYQPPTKPTTDRRPPDTKAVRDCGAKSGSIGVRG